MVLEIRIDLEIRCDLNVVSPVTPQIDFPPNQHIWVYLSQYVTIFPHLCCVVLLVASPVLWCIPPSKGYAWFHVDFFSQQFQ